MSGSKAFLGRGWSFPVATDATGAKVINDIFAVLSHRTEVECVSTRIQR